VSCALALAVVLRTGTADLSLRKAAQVFQRKISPKWRESRPPCVPLAIFLRAAHWREDEAIACGDQGKWSVSECKMVGAPEADSIPLAEGNSLELPR
jgi:hypothetical protein